jgi:alkaline phosphatase D
MIGIWDDHDYGINDAGKDTANKEERKTMFLDFLNIYKTLPSSSSSSSSSSLSLQNTNNNEYNNILKRLYNQEGLYHSFDVNTNTNTIHPSSSSSLYKKSLLSSGTTSSTITTTTFIITAS